MGLETIVFECAVAKVTTMADGGIRVIVDLPETAIMQTAALMECKRLGLALTITAIPKSKDELSRKIYS